MGKIETLSEYYARKGQQRMDLYEIEAEDFERLKGPPAPKICTMSPLCWIVVMACVIGLSLLIINLP
jgi:hypothetical protein